MDKDGADALKFAGMIIVIWALWMLIVFKPEWLLEAAQRIYKAFSPW